MAGLLTGLLSGIAGYAQGKSDKRKTDAANAEQAKQDAMTQAGIDERGRVDAASIARDNAEAKKIVDDNATAAAIAAANTKFESGLKLPPNWSKLPDSQKIGYLQQRLNAAQVAHDDNVAKQTQDLINSITLGTTREANAAYTSGAKTNETNAHTSLLQAQAAAERDLPARARQIAAGRNAAEMQRATMEVQGRAQLARYNGNLRLGLTQLAAAYRAQNIDAEDAVRLAIADYEGNVRQYQAAHSPQAQALGTVDNTIHEPQLIIPPSESPNVTVNAYVVDPRTGQVSPAQPGAGNGRVQPLPVRGASTTNTTTNTTTPRVDPAKVQSIVASEVASGTSDAVILASAQKHGLDLGMVRAAIAKARAGTQGRPQPLPVLQGVAPQLLGQ